jgi:17beta-estradiol 17-dehydrogenase / very-long-chain 3-oxoacyl-CoA reductase
MDRSTQNFLYFLAVVGGVAFTVILAKLVWSLAKIVLPEKNYLKRYGENSWAVVTGATHGIGLGFCEELAALGFNICIVDRNEVKIKQALQLVETRANDKHIATDYILADFARSAADGFYNTIFASLQAKGILRSLSILVNNAGISN